MPTPDGGDAIELEITRELLWALADETNRLVLRYFLESDQSRASVIELARYVAECHGGIYRGEQAKAETRLHHKSLPELSDQELIEYDPDNRIVTVREDRYLPPDLEDHVLLLDEE